MEVIAKYFSARFIGPMHVCSDCYKKAKINKEDVSLGMVLCEAKDGFLFCGRCYKVVEYS